MRSIKAKDLGEGWSYELAYNGNKVEIRYFEGLPEIYCDKKEVTDKYPELERELSRIAKYSKLDNQKYTALLTCCTNSQQSRRPKEGEEDKTKIIITGTVKRQPYLAMRAEIERIFMRKGSKRVTTVWRYRGFEEAWNRTTKFGLHTLIAIPNNARGKAGALHMHNGGEHHQMKKGMIDKYKKPRVIKCRGNNKT